MRNGTIVVLGALLLLILAANLLFFVGMGRG